MMTMTPMSSRRTQTWMIFSYDNDDEEVGDITNNHIPTHPSTSEVTDNHKNTGVNGIPTIDDTVTSTGLEEPGDNRLGEITGVVGGLEASSESNETTGVEQHMDADETIEVDQAEELEDSDHDNAEEAEYEKAEQLGIEAAHDDDGTLPKRICKKRQMKYMNTTMPCSQGLMLIMYFHLMVMNTPIKFLIF